MKATSFLQGLILLSATVSSGAAGSIPADFFVNTCADSGGSGLCGDGPLAILTSARVDPPDDLRETHVNIGDFWEATADDRFDRSYRVTISGGTGTGYLRFHMWVTGMDHYETFMPREYAESSSAISAPVQLSMLNTGWWPLHGIANECWLDCLVQFTYDVPFWLRFQAYSSSVYWFARHQPGEEADPLIPGTGLAEDLWLTSQASVALAGVFDVDGHLRPNPLATISAVATPEPASLALLLPSLALVAWHRRRQRRDRENRA